MLYPLCRKAKGRLEAGLQIRRLFERRVNFKSLDIGDRVLLRNLGLRGKHKLESKWSRAPFVVVGKMPNLPLFKIKRGDGAPSTKTVHRDHLLPIGQHVRVPSTDFPLLDLKPEQSLVGKVKEKLDLGL